jgi:hydroxymethylpyrimidine/phosphomethylpyrimidine kinase
VKVALTIAGSDSGGGAGIQADLRTFAAHGLHPTSAITAVTAQNSVAVTAWAAIDPQLVAKQIETVAEDMAVAAVKTGMLGEAAIVRITALTLARLGLPHLVVDPVMVAKSGDRLLAPEAVEVYREHLIPLAEVVTPNLPETEVLLERRVRDVEAMREAASELCRRGARAVVVKGGHLEGDALDVLCVGGELHELREARIDTRNTHGTGCTFSAAIAARLALGAGILEAVRGAKLYLTEAIRRSYSVGSGHGPVDHLHPLRHG